MNKDRLIGICLVLISTVIIVVYGYILYGTSYDIALLKLTSMIAVIGIFGIIGWIGYTLAGSPPTKPIEEIEKEIERELAKLKEDSSSSASQFSNEEKKD